MDYGTSTATARGVASLRTNVDYSIDEENADTGPYESEPWIPRSGAGIAPTIAQYANYDELLRNSDQVPLREFQALGANMPKFADGLFDEPPGPGLRRKRKKLADFTDAEKQARRKLKNRIAAQSARDRKRYETEVQCNNLDRLSEEVERLRHENTSLRAENTSLRGDNSTLRTENKDLREELTQLTKAKRKKRRESSPESDYSSGRGSRPHSGGSSGCTPLQQQQHLPPKEEPRGAPYPLFINAASAATATSSHDQPTLVYAQPPFTSTPTNVSMSDTRNPSPMAFTTSPSSSCSNSPPPDTAYVVTTQGPAQPRTTIVRTSAKAKRSPPQLLSTRLDPVASSSPVFKVDSADSLPILQGVNQRASFVAIRPRVEQRERACEESANVPQRVRIVAKRTSRQQRSVVLARQGLSKEAQEEWKMVRGFYTLILTILFNTASTALKHRETKAVSNSFNLRLRTVAMMKRIHEASRAAMARSQAVAPSSRSQTNASVPPPMALTGMPAPISIWETANLNEVETTPRAKPPAQGDQRASRNCSTEESTRRSLQRTHSWTTFSKEWPKEARQTMDRKIMCWTEFSTMETASSIGLGEETKQTPMTGTCPLHLAVTPNCLACQCKTPVSLSPETCVKINMADHLLRQATAMVEQKTKRRQAVGRRPHSPASAAQPAMETSPLTRSPPISRQTSTEEPEAATSAHKTLTTVPQQSPTSTTAFAASQTVRR